MDDQDIYYTIPGKSEGDYREKGSKFLAYSFPVRDESDIKACLLEVRKIHPKARHHCYAYRLGMDKNMFRANDDGEPSGSAGRPILGQIDSFGLTNVLVVVVRYFGGTKLGVPGLINAYKTSTAEALEGIGKVEKTVMTEATLTFGYDMMSPVMNGLKSTGVNILEQEFTEQGRVRFGTPKSEFELSIVRLKAAIYQIPKEMAEEKKWEKITFILHE